MYELLKNQNYQYVICRLKKFYFICSIGAKTQPESKCPELLANYCDMLLRKTPLSKKLTSEEVEKKLRDVVCKRLLYLLR